MKNWKYGSSIVFMASFLQCNYFKLTDLEKEMYFYEKNENKEENIRLFWDLVEQLLFIEDKLEEIVKDKLKKLNLWSFIKEQMLLIPDINDISIDFNFIDIFGRSHDKIHISLFNKEIFKETGMKLEELFSDKNIDYILEKAENEIEKYLIEVRKIMTNQK